jgi:hypothetical protein
MNKKLHFRVVYGFGPTDFYSISQEELQAAKMAQAEGVVFECEEGSIGGNFIQRIEPDYNRYLGYNPEYKLVGEDLDEIPRNIISAHREALQLAGQGQNDNLRLT